MLLRSTQWISNCLDCLRLHPSHHKIYLLGQSFFRRFSGTPDNKQSYKVHCTPPNFRLRVTTSVAQVLCRLREEILKSHCQKRKPGTSAKFSTTRVELPHHGACPASLDRITSSLGCRKVKQHRGEQSAIEKDLFFKVPADIDHAMVEQRAVIMQTRGPLQTFCNKTTPSRKAGAMPSEWR